MSSALATVANLATSLWNKAKPVLAAVGGALMTFLQSPAGKLTCIGIIGALSTIIALRTSNKVVFVAGMVLTAACIFAAGAVAAPMLGSFGTLAAITTAIV